MKDNIIVHIKTKNRNKLLSELYRLNINIYNLKMIDKNNIELEIRSYDYDKLSKFRILNDIDIKDYKGKNKIKEIVNKYYIFILFIIIGLMILVFLSNIIFNINVITNNNDIKSLVYTSLEKEGIKKYSIRKSNKELEDIKNKIVKDNKDKIEWLSIERIGTTYNIKVIERIMNTKDIDNSCTNIIAKYNSVIKSINVYEGLQVKDINEYVNKEDLIVSGNIYFNDLIKGSVNSDATIYGEVWKKVKASFDIYELDKIKTGNSKKVISFNFINKKITSTYDSYNKYEKVLVKNNILPIYISFDILEETKDKGIYSESEYLLNSIEKIDNYIKEGLKDNEYIISNKLLKYEINSNKIDIEMFYKLYLDIVEERGC